MDNIYQILTKELRCPFYKIFWNLHLRRRRPSSQLLQRDGAADARGAGAGVRRRRRPGPVGDEVVGGLRGGVEVPPHVALRRAARHLLADAPHRGPQGAQPAARLPRLLQSYTQHNVTYHSIMHRHKSISKFLSTT